MDSVCSEGIDDESSPHCKKIKPWEKVFGDSVAVNNALVPKKPRSAIKKRARGNIVLPWSISRKKRRVFDGIKRPRVKKSRLIMKQGEISKDEEEVAETLNSLAKMFCNSAETNKPVLDDEPSVIKSSTEDSVVLNAQEESEKVITSNHSSAIVENFESSHDRSMIALDQASPSGIQYGKCRYNKEDKGKGILMTPSFSSTEFFSSKKRSFVYPTWSQNTSSGYIANKIQYPQVVVEPKKTRKRCSGHVHIARLIKDLQKTEASKGLTLGPTQLTFSRGVDQMQYHTSGGYQMRRINGSNDQQTFPILPSLRLGPDFLSLGGGGCRADTSTVALKQIHASYQQLQSHPTIHSSSSTFNGCTSDEAALQAKLSNSMFQQRRPAHGGFPIPHLPEWQIRGRNSASFFNEAQPRFPHLHSAICPMPFQPLPPQLRYMAFVNSSSSFSNTKRRYHHLNPAFTRTNGVLYSDNMQQVVKYMD